MRQDDAVEAPVGAKVEQHELAVGLSLGQCRLNVLLGVRALVVRALRARRGVRAKGECQEGGQREPLHTGLHGPTGIWEVYTARALQGFECCFREREGDRVPGLEDRDELGRHTPGYFPRKSRRNPTVSIVPWAMTDTQRLRPATKYKSPNTKPPNPAVIMPEGPEYCCPRPKKFLVTPRGAGQAGGVHRGHAATRGGRYPRKRNSSPKAARVNAERARMGRR